MKRLIKFRYYAAIIFIVAAITACTKLDVSVQSQLTSSNFPKTPAEYIAASGPVYTQLRTQYAQSYWFMQELSTDEAIIVARAGNWYDGGKWRDLHYHSWTIDHEHVNTTWQWGFSEISTCNRLLALFNTLPDDVTRRTTIAEIRTTRAFVNFLMMDLYGNIPIIKSFGDTTGLVTTNRNQVFQYIESEVKAAMPDLNTSVGAITYGRPTRWMAFALLAKMYVNAEYYTGRPRYTDAVTVCDSIIQSKNFLLDADYLEMFNIDNGPQIRDFIFAIPYDNMLAQGQYFARYSLHPALKNKYSLPFIPSDPMATLPDFYNLYNDPNDARNKQWLTGKQYDNLGNPIIIQTTKVGLDQTYKGADAATVVNYQMEFTPALTLDPTVDPLNLDVGNDELGKAKGYRNNKFYPDKTSLDRNQSNDMPVFRLADVILTKAEAILRGANATYGETPLTLINEVRARAGASPLSSINLQTVLDERGRELAFEGWRRNDLIRFGQWEYKWGYKTDANPLHRIYPIPASQVQLNPGLTQNSGY
ncbi:putative outer membrane starch-binding protein [Mucilaginibacter frigoritolerans]|uniref:Putative outer membrane starch-binding protein n=1 Tax=Mucilaginibacter frigoritolerans TaxID=652788 RepID=A0A562TPW0_9SPHI|nr:RagB/SusD family nutrient uptake outer membrane protein [Mucilaginibacter frigoritolerans]TWI95597.1 putative outer membrane starch-binding protein [Mucilaginibacter frigoritolerans]